ncbi:fungal specific transcription factor domain-containing protein [Aspergillus stella-maris]|uniref:fungal specific transcription factor domain-containing protein n=1 Tax=Aspergillus stella-maris TaxID=1810926 RepID=UPI003CCE4522
MREDLTQLGITSPGLQQAPAVHFQKNPISRERLASGCRALSFLQNRAMIDRGIDLFFQSIECVHIHCGEFIVRQWLSQLWFVHGDTLSTQTPEQVRQLCYTISENTAIPQVFDGSTTARQWVYSATGKHIRWGVIAMIANYVGTYALVTASSDPFFQEFNVDRTSLLSQMTEVSDICLEICRECSALDDTFIWALFENYNITKYTKGEASYATYRISAEVSSALVAMGLHQEIKANSRVPFFLAELRKRVRALVYMEEISIATFLGRPPRLSHRYINLDLPLDLTDEQLFSDNPQWLAAAIARLDQQGYNQDGKIHHVTWIRSSLGFVERKEDILELSLRNFTPDEVRRNAAMIRQKTDKHWATLPQYMLNLRDGTFGLERQQRLDVNELHFQNVFRQGHLANTLLLHRVLMRKAGTGPSGLIKTAQTILGDVLRLYRRVEMSAATSFIYFLAVHGLRSAVILVIELLKQEQVPASTYPVESLLPRSRTIQDICIFVSKLSDLDSDPMFGDRELCEKGRKFLSRVLDKLLDRPSTTITERPLPHLDANAYAFSNDTVHNAYVSEGYSMTGDFGLEMSGPVAGADHEFRLWLENIEGRDWIL